MNYESMYNEVECFIEEELQDMKDYPDCYLEEDIKKNTKFLEKLDRTDIEKIGNEILDDEWLNQKLREVLRDYVYHYKKA